MRRPANVDEKVTTVFSLYGASLLTGTLFAASEEDAPSGTRDLRPLMVVRCVRYPRAHRISRTPASHPIMSVVVVLSRPLQTMACAIGSIAVRPQGNPADVAAGDAAGSPLEGYR